MKQNSVVFVAFDKTENLGIRYMCAILSNAGFPCKVIEFDQDHSVILDELSSFNPLLAGFSVIFEEHICRFKDLIQSLRENNVDCHFTAGGHFASLQPSELFHIIPYLDSIVRFEGEGTILDLATTLSEGKDHRKVLGISYKSGEKVVDNDLRPIEQDLDSFPIPIRSSFREYALQKKYTTIIAGRGCVHRCTFCDSREFFYRASGPVKRTRDPGKVVDEINRLYRENECSVFLFQDDDFPVNKKSNWIRNFCGAIQENGLAKKIMWKINCRPDEVDLDTFRFLSEHGLFRVFMGIEDGTEAGLMHMNKRLSIPDILQAITILKSLDIRIDYGFMLFHPSTSFDSLEENLDFLASICEDGYMPVNYLRMMPYLETEMTKKLKVENRLKGKPGFYDYDFHEKSMNTYCKYVTRLFKPWLTGTEGLNNYIKWAQNYLSVYSFYHEQSTRIQPVEEELRKVVSDSNIFIIKSLRDISEIFRHSDMESSNSAELAKYSTQIKERHNVYLSKLNTIIQKVELYSLTNVFLSF